MSRVRPLVMAITLAMLGIGGASSARGESAAFTVADSLPPQARIRVRFLMESRRTMMRRTYTGEVVSMDLSALVAVGRNGIRDSIPFAEIGSIDVSHSVSSGRGAIAGAQTGALSMLALTGLADAFASIPSLSETTEDVGFADYATGLLVGAAGGALYGAFFPGEKWVRWKGLSAAKQH